MPMRAQALKQKRKEKRRKSDEKERNEREEEEEEDLRCDDALGDPGAKDNHIVGCLLQGLHCQKREREKVSKRKRKEKKKKEVGFFGGKKFGFFLGRLSFHLLQLLFFLLSLFHVRDSSGKTAPPPAESPHRQCGRDRHQWNGLPAWKRACQKTPGCKGFQCQDRETAEEVSTLLISGFTASFLLFSPFWIHGT